MTTWPVLMLGFAIVAMPISDTVGLLSLKARDSGTIVIELESPPEGPVPIAVAPVGAAGAAVASPSAPSPLTLRFADVAPASPDPATNRAGGIPAEPMTLGEVAPVTPQPVVVAPSEPTPYVVAFLKDTAPVREEALGLNSALKAETQRRLNLMGYDTGPIDGVLGEESRAAIARWQSDFGFVETGHLDDVVLAALVRRSEPAWNIWRTEVQARARYVAKRPPAAPDASYEPTFRGPCARDDAGRIASDQGFGCGLRGIREGIARFFSKLAHKTPPPQAEPPRSGNER